MEELTLYTLQQQEELSELEAVRGLSAENEALRERIAALERAAGAARQ